MKRIALSTLSLALLGATGVAHAQSSVTLYGLIDESIQFAHNTVDATGANKNQVGLVAGNLQGSRWGLKGTEDLGGGLKAIFQLENGFDPNNGRLGQGSRMFGRQAYVGLTGDQWGTVTLGRQYDPLVDLVQPLTADNYFGSTFTTPGDVDNNDNSSRTNNAVKYTSPVWGGFQFEGMYAFGGVAGQTGAGQTWSGAATYATGPFSIAAGYFRAENPHTAAPTRAAFGSSSTSDGTFDNQINGVTATHSTSRTHSRASVRPRSTTSQARTWATRQRRHCWLAWATRTRRLAATRAQRITRFPWAATTTCRSARTSTWSAHTSTQAATSALQTAHWSAQAQQSVRTATTRLPARKKWSAWVSVTSSNRTCRTAEARAV